MVASKPRFDGAFYWGPEAVHDYPDSAPTDPCHEAPVLPGGEFQPALGQDISSRRLLVELARFTLACFGVALACGFVSMGIALMFAPNA